MNLQTITLGGGCFWCTEAVFDRVRGITDVESGYTNGHTVNPTYEQICQGDTGHAEVVRLTFDADEISLEEILEIFFHTHDPTTLNRQGNDVGTQYRSGIYYDQPEHGEVASAMIRQMSQDKLFSAPSPPKWRRFPTTARPRRITRITLRTTLTPGTAHLWWAPRWRNSARRLRAI